MKLRCLLLGTLWLCARGFASASERCDDWGVDTMKHKPVYNGEPARIKCPLFEAFLKYNYSTAHSAGLTLIWYWIGRGQDLEEPINFRLPDNHISKEKDTLWFRPALLNDTGNYTCMLRNTTYCSKVAFPLEVVNKDPGSCISQAVKPEEVLLYLSYTNINLTCPDVEGFSPANVQPKFNWFMNCNLVHNFYERRTHGINLTFIIVREMYAADYSCVATYRENGRDFNLTRTFRVKVVAAPYRSTVPQIITPDSRVIYEFKPGVDMSLVCEVHFTFLKDSPQEVWWTIDGRTTDEVTDLKFNVSHTEEPLTVGDVKVTKTLFVSKVTEKDLRRNYTCFAHNNNGTSQMQALVRMKAVVPRYTLELACGLGATVLLVVALTVIYHAYWLELVLFYRAHFGTDETILDGKEYDIYVSYARNAEEEEFVLLTLRGVLENEFGYKLCIFDRDSLPGGSEYPRQAGKQATAHAFCPLSLSSSLPLSFPLSSRQHKHTLFPSNKMKVVRKFVHTEAEKHTSANWRCLTVYIIVTGCMVKWAQNIGHTITMTEWETLWRKKTKYTYAWDLKENWLKSFHRWYITPQKLGKMYKGTQNSCWKCKDHIGSYYHAWWTCKEAGKFWKMIHTESQKILGKKFPMKPEYYLLNLTDSETQFNINDDKLFTYINTAGRIIFAKHWKSQLTPGKDEWLEKIEDIRDMDELTFLLKMYRGQPIKRTDWDQYKKYMDMQ
uniref:Interleukin 1 receptor accessory protein n=1 Tax=Anolis carolinensis TaxID=28377 RepID=A0A803SRC0_ANOCA|nr:PREDICTED: interleukin-1 receptor accessory protein isoform X1 [Anolis carolinensis]|eukprot:XP_016852420.1 PREDICTED: interleukin-1 receptor accessory protein isoform X1 [Anolis carolinensis]